MKVEFSKEMDYFCIENRSKGVIIAYAYNLDYAKKIVEYWNRCEN